MCCWFDFFVRVGFKFRYLFVYYKEMIMLCCDFLKYLVVLGVVLVLLLWSCVVFVVECFVLFIFDLLMVDVSNCMQLIVKVGQFIFVGKNVVIWGYNGNLLGLVVQFYKGKSVIVDIYN